MAAVWLFGSEAPNSAVLGEVLAACLAVLVLFRFPGITKFKALGLEFEIERARQVTLEVKHATEDARSVVADLRAVRKDEAIRRLSEAANRLTKSVMETFPGATGLCPGMLDYTHLIQETRDDYSIQFYGALMDFYASAQSAYSRLVALGEDRSPVAALHEQVRAARDVLTEAIRAERSDAGRDL
jgi:Xaa-Pro aminopeptidase